jgi:hypothetical protein
MNPAVGIFRPGEHVPGIVAVRAAAADQAVGIFGRCGWRRPFRPAGLMQDDVIALAIQKDPDGIVGVIALAADTAGALPPRGPCRHAVQVQEHVLAIGISAHAEPIVLHAATTADSAAVPGAANRDDTGGHDGCPCLF